MTILLLHMTISISQDNPSSVSLLAIYQQRCVKRQQDHHNPIARYYERLSAVQARGSQASHQVLRDILKEVQSTMVPRTMVREWATATFQSATDYWSFRKVNQSFKMKTVLKIHYFL